MSNQLLKLRLEATPPEEGAGYPSYADLVRALPSQVRVALENSEDNVALLWVAPTAPPADLSGRTLWLQTDDSGRPVGFKLKVNGTLTDIFPGHRTGDLMYRVPAIGETGPWFVADGENGTDDLSEESNFQIGTAKLHQFVGVSIP